MLIDTTYRFLGDSFSGTATKNTTTSFDYQLDETRMIYGAEMVYENSCFGDFIEMMLVDVDNILGYGNDFVVATWIKKWFVPMNQNYWVVKSDMTSSIPAGLYVRLKYTSTGNTQDVNLGVNLFMVSPK